MTNLNEYDEYVEALITDLGINKTIDVSHLEFIENELVDVDETKKFVTKEDKHLISKTIESIGSEFLLNNISSYKNYFQRSFILRRDELKVNKNKSLENYFYLSVSGILAERNSEIRLLLRDFEIKIDELDWSKKVYQSILTAFILLTRKSNGWTDIENATNIIHDLRELQKELEGKYLKSNDEKSTTSMSLIGSLIAYYNLAKIIEISSSYIIEGGSKDPIIQVKKFYNRAITALRVTRDTHIEHLADMLYLGCIKHIENCIWYTTSSVGQKIREFVKQLTSKENKPIMELWPSQRDAIRQNLFDVGKKCVVLEMPTSAGKTLLAEFSIIQALALNPEHKVVYVVPTRALVNQTTLQLRQDLVPLGYNVECAVPVFEISPTEDIYLREDFDVLISTPEKLDLLIRTKHPSVEKISLVVADEAHNIGNKNRGSTLELFLASISREKTETKFMLLTPFLSNAEEIGNWLGKDNSNAIKVDWKPSERITAVVTYEGRTTNRGLKLTTLPSAHCSDVKDKHDFKVKSKYIFKTKSKSNVALSAALSFMEKGRAIHLCPSRKKCLKYSMEILNILDDKPSLTDLHKLTIDYVADELGENHVLTKSLKKGVAFHHAGLSQEVRFLIEKLVSDGDIKLVFATTTLAQGVNFPIRTVVVEKVTRYNMKTNRQEDLDYSEFWNIAGRAGRALMDNLGLILFSYSTNEQVKKYENYLQKEANHLISSISKELNTINELDEKFGLKFVHNYPALSKFLQYIFHTVSVSGYNNTESDIEDVLLSSLAYYQINQTDLEAGRKLLQIANIYLNQIKSKTKTKKIVELIDGTGFSSMSVDLLFARRELFNEISKWNKGNLFDPKSDTLKNMIDLLSGIPELDLTRTNRPGDLDTAAIAELIKDWVLGKNVEEISSKYFSHVEDPNERILNASQYIHSTLVGQLSWGMSALQKVSLFGKKTEDIETVGHIPAMLYYGVSNKEATILRMAGVPRKIAQELGVKHPDKIKKLKTFKQIRSWLNDLDQKEWKSSKSKLSEKQSKDVWKLLNGFE